MIAILKNVLINNDHEQIPIELPNNNVEISLFRPTDLSKREEYFVIARLYEQSEEAAQTLLNERSQEIFDAINQSGTVEQFFEKNCTMILCHELAKISTETMLALEEDRYNFKKNVITYTNEEIAGLNSYLSDKGLEKLSNGIINEIINSKAGESFRNFKSIHTLTSDYYSLVMKLALKLPFITYIPQEQQLNNLIMDIESSISESQISLYRQLANSDDTWTDENARPLVEKIWGEKRD